MPNVQNSEGYDPARTKRDNRKLGAVSAYLATVTLLRGAHPTALSTWKICGEHHETGQSHSRVGIKVAASLVGVRNFHNFFFFASCMCHTPLGPCTVPKTKMQPSTTSEPLQLNKQKKLCQPARFLETSHHQSTRPNSVAKNEPTEHGARALNIVGVAGMSLSGCFFQKQNFHLF